MSNGLEISFEASLIATIFETLFNSLKLSNERSTIDLPGIL